MLQLQNSQTLNKTKHSIPFANQTEVPILHYVTVTLNTTMEDDSRQFTISFAIAVIKYNILGTPCFEKYIPNMNIQDFPLQFKHQSTIHPRYTKFTSLLSKDNPYLSYYRINSKTQIRLKPNSSKIAHFPIRTYYNLHFSNTPQNQFFPTIPHTSLLNFVQYSILLKFSQLTHQTLVQLLYKSYYTTTCRTYWIYRSSNYK